MQHALSHGRVLTTSMHREGAESEECTQDGLMMGHEYGVKAVVMIDEQELVILQNPHMQVSPEQMHL